MKAVIIFKDGRKHELISDGQIYKVTDPDNVEILILRTSQNGKNREIGRFDKSEVQEYYTTKL